VYADETTFERAGGGQTVGYGVLVVPSAVDRIVVVEALAALRADPPGPTAGDQRLDSHARARARSFLKPEI
jgi:hypothetical protein